MRWTAVKSVKLQVKSLDSKVEEHTHQLDSLNMSIFDIERNTSAQLELEHKDVVSLAVSETLYRSLKKAKIHSYIASLQGKVASLQDDNLNVSSSLASLSVRCSNEITALLTNLTDIHEKIKVVEAVQSRLEGGEEENLVQNKQTMLHQQSSERRLSKDANVEGNGDMKDLERTEHEGEEDKSEKS